MSGSQQAPDLGSATWLAELVIDRYCNPDGFVGRRADALTGRLLDRRPIIEDLGDYLQYFIVLAELTGEESLKDWSLSQLRLALDATQDHRGLVHTMRLDPGLTGWLHRLIYAQVASCDTLWGLAEVARLTREGWVSNRTMRFVQAALELAFDNSLPVYAVLPLGNRSLKLPFTSPMIAGYWIECLLSLHRSLSADTYLQAARSIAESILERTPVGETNLFPFRIPTSPLGKLLAPILDAAFLARRRPRSSSHILVKGGVYLVYGLLALYRQTHAEHYIETIRRWKLGLGHHLRARDGRFFNHWDRGMPNASSIRLTTNHSVIEVLIDIYFDSGDEEALDWAVAAADTWLDRRSDSGLIPDTDDRNIAALDPQVDFAINLLKLGQVTSNERWHIAAWQLAESIQKHHVLPFGLAWQVDAQNGSALATAIEPKYLGLYLKLPLLLHFVSADRHLLNDPELRLLATDR